MRLFLVRVDTAGSQRLDLVVVGVGRVAVVAAMAGCWRRKGVDAAAVSAVLVVCVIHSLRLLLVVVDELDFLIREDIVVEPSATSSSSSSSSSLFLIFIT